MNLEQTAAQPTGSHDTHVSGVQLRLSRALWGLCLVLGVGLYIGAFPAYFAFLHTVVASAALGGQQLTPANVRTLHALGLSLDFYAWLTLSVNALLLPVYVLVGVVLFWRASSDRMALLASFTLVLFPVTLNGQIVGLLPPMWTVPTECARFLGSVSLGLFFYLFPSGRFVPRWTGVLAVAWVVYWALDIFLPTWPDILSLLGLLILLALLASQLALQIYRYRRVSTPTERQQIKWVVFGLFITFGSILLAQALLFVILPLFVPVDPLTNTLGQTLSTLLLLFFPLSIGFAILRYHLWDIDLIINRTLVYGALTASIVAIYAFVVGYFGLAFQVYGSPIISILATGLVAVLFQPLRQRLQRLVNRLMYGERDDPYLVISRLGKRLEGTLAPNAVLPTIIETVVQALKLPYAAISLKQGEELVIVASHGSPKDDLVRLPLVYQAEQVGEFDLAPRGPGEAFTPADHVLLADLARQAGTAAHAVRLAADLKRLTMDLQRSRERLVTAREEERRRLRRDLHDGLGPTLGHLTLQLDGVSDLIVQDPSAAQAQVAHLKALVQGTMADIRQLVYALRPPALDELGLITALCEQATQYQQVGGLQVTVEAPTTLPLLPAAVEVAAYCIALEALTNVVRHAQAHTCCIILTLSDALLLEILDDGRGFPHTLRAGVGLASMRERAAELGGTCVIEARPEGGMRVHACLPLPKE
jgi:signal transduction histidine kinase